LADVPVWHLFAYMNRDDGSRDEHRMLAEWQVQDAVRWATTRGYDNILLSRTKARASFRDLEIMPRESGAVAA